MDDLWCLLYILVELRGPLPWARIRDRNRILRMKKDIELDELLENCPVEMVPFAEHISTLNYYIRPDYAFLHNLLDQVMTAGGIRFSDPYDWEKNATVSRETAVSATPVQSEERRTSSLNSSDGLLPSKDRTEADNPFPAEFFSQDPFGF
ncbi:hypothetical protein ANCCAN_12942 [Ancylostoma caninum]|uniref:Non-specific serine/threonine protein kinase n=1 Tax=Ancylostoma caninum TaxID=29170 RepID=A0A368GDK7_ANCCA|nr:hypothetical protein ANCCAN_12942 [Ancylostoma caninum]